MLRLLPRRRRYADLARSLHATTEELARTRHLVDLLEKRESRHAEAAKQEARATQQLVRALDAQTQSAVNLRTLLTITRPLPVLGRFTASADLLVVLVEELLARRPRTVVEAGSGVSTLVLALAVEQHGLDTRVVALEHLPAYAEQTRALLRKHEVEHRAEVREAPLADVGLPGHDTPWYDPAALADLDDVGLVLVDGPPEAIGEAVRWPLLPLLVERLAPACTVLVDDTARPGRRGRGRALGRRLPGVPPRGPRAGEGRGGAAARLTPSGPVDHLVRGRGRRTPRPGLVHKG